MIGGKWKPIILWHLYTANQPCRFGMLRRAIPNATEKMIVQQLRELQDAGIVKRRVFRQVPPRVEYSLTDDGKELQHALEALCAWGEQYMKRMGAVIQSNLPARQDGKGEPGGVGGTGETK